MEHRRRDLFEITLVGLLFAGIFLAGVVLEVRAEERAAEVAP